MLLWQGMAAEAENARLDAGRQAQFTAVRIRQVLQDPRCLERFPPVLRFELRDAALWIPPEVGWLEPPSPPDLASLDLLLQDRLAQLERRLQGGIAPAGLASWFDQLLASSAISAAERDWLTAEAGWIATRQKLHSWRDRCIRTLDQRQGGAVPAASILLIQRQTQALPSWARTRICQLPADQAEAILSRLEELGSDTSQLRAAQVQAHRHRSSLQRVAAIPASLRQAPYPSVQVIGGRALILHQPSERIVQGILADAGELRAALAQLATATWTALPADTAARLRSAEPAEHAMILPGLLSLATNPTSPRLLQHRWLPLTLLLALGLISGSALWLMLRSARREVELARTRGEFLTMVTHELKTPVAGIRLLAEMLGEGRAASLDKEREYHQRLQSESLRLGMLIENVLDLGRMERGELALDLQPLDPAEVLTEAWQVFAPLAEAGGMELRLDLPPSAPTIHGDRHALLQALLNLMDNARKYAAGGRRLDLSLRKQGAAVEIRLRDHGPGISAADRSRIFERFRRGSDQQHGKTPGVGLGLYLARNILLQHGGDLGLDSGTTPGCCFCIRIPTRPADPSRSDAKELRA